MTDRDITPDEILSFWFPDGDTPDPDEHTRLWMWRMRGGADAEIIARYSDLTARAAAGDLDGWAASPHGRLALIIVLDQFPRSVWAGTPRAFAQDPKALGICLQGLDNGHFDALDNVWFKSVFKLPLEHCECPDHMANLDRAVAIGAAMVDEAPENLRAVYELAAGQPAKHRAVIARFGHHPHRNTVLGRKNTPQEQDYIDKGEFPHQTNLTAGMKKPG